MQKQTIDPFQQMYRLNTNEEFRDSKWEIEFFSVWEVTTKEYIRQQLLLKTVIESCF